MVRPEYEPWALHQIVLVTGGREYDNYLFLASKMEFHHPDLIVQGGSTGADMLAVRWAKLNGVPFVTFPISKDQWERYGKPMGPYRNTDMMTFLEEHAAIVDGVVDWTFGPLIEAVAFAGHNGTANMCDLVLRSGMNLWDYRDHPEGQRLGESRMNQ